MQLPLDQLVMWGGAFLTSGLFGVVIYFLKKALAKLDHLDTCLDSLKLQIEREFISVHTFEKQADRTREVTRELYGKIEELSKELARLGAHIDIGKMMRELISRGN